MSEARARPRVAIAGAGISGLAWARERLARGAWVTVFEEQRVLGGRNATQATEAGGFDHGAQYFTVGPRPFRAVARQTDRAAPSRGNWRRSAGAMRPR